MEFRYNSPFFKSGNRLLYNLIDEHIYILHLICTRNV